jgi:hypothetical protein
MQDSGFGIQAFFREVSARCSPFSILPVSAARSEKALAGGSDK